MEKITKTPKITLKLPWPEQALWINRRAGHSHWKEAPAKESALSDGCSATLEALNGEPKPDWTDKRLALTITAHKLNKAPYDLDNLSGALKHHLDGIAATLGINDSQFDHVTIVRGEPRKKDPCVIVEVYEWS